MGKKLSFIANLCEKITLQSLYILLFLTPIFFLPWTSEALDFNKQALLIILATVALFCWIIKSLISGTVTLKINWLTAIIGAALIVYIASTIFSVTQYGSFWGWPLATHESLLSFMYLCLVYFLVSHTFSEKETIASLYILGISAFLCQLYGILQLFGVYGIPFAFAKNKSFNTIGSLGGLGVFSATLLPLFIIALVTVRKWWKALFFLNILTAFLILLIINYAFLWYVVGFGAILLIISWMVKKEVFDARMMALPVFFLIISLFFIVLKPQIGWLPQQPLEIIVPHGSNVQIDKGAIKENPLLGSGPGTFSYAFAKYKQQDANTGSLWNLNFNAGASKILTLVATVGILGAVLVFLAILLPIIYGIVYFFRHGSKQDSKKVTLLVAVVAVVMTQLLASFLYYTTLSQEIITFFFVGIIAALVYKHHRGRGVYNLRPASFATLLIVFAFTASFIFGSGLLLLQGQRYFAEMQYRKGLALFQENKKDEAIVSVKKAIQHNSNAYLYANQLAFFSLANLQEKAVTLNPESVEGKAVIQNLIADTIAAANTSVKVAPFSIDNWGMRAYVCQNLVGIIGDGFECALESYEKAIALSPVNSYFYFQEGNLYLNEAGNLALQENLTNEQLQKKAELLAKAKEKFNKAIEIKEDYALAYLRLALVASLAENSNDQIAALKNASQYSGNDATTAFQVGLVYFQQKNWAKAATEFEKALMVVPNYANAMYYLGLTYDEQGKKSAAITLFEKLAELNTQNETVQKILVNLKNGQPALAGLGEQPTPPVDETPGETPPPVTP